ncbi:hypothetical protein [uncultured Desulfobacter sp.]|uniref:hypothetical protein n=1 Tax=uncultured Desulfobacter sp. TaxID=240139 RepID=UPI0029F50F64|nr:hypothetical protein [uncultured Desulfobacter sp.]
MIIDPEFEKLLLELQPVVTCLEKLREKSFCGDHRNGCAIDIKGMLPFDPSGVVVGSTCYTFIKKIYALKHKKILPNKKNKKLNI